MRTVSIFHIIVSVALGGAACSGALVVDDKPKADRSAENALWTGNAEDCPAHAPMYGDACSVAHGETCAYHFDNPDMSGSQRYKACVCAPAVGDGGALWDCYADSSGPPCPDTEPHEGSDCFGYFGQTCEYPFKTVCACPDPASGDRGSGTWSCQANPPRVAANDEAAVDSTKPVNQLSSDERMTWCRWYVDLFTGGPGHPEPTDTVDANGYVTSAICSSSPAFECSGALAVLPSADCVGNLSLSTCSAPVGALSDCVRTFANQCWPSPDGCAAYLDTPGCSGTLVNSAASINANGAGGSSGDGTFGAGANTSVAEVCGLKVR
jgi:hypothetical protein